MNGKYQPAIVVGLQLGVVLIIIGVITALMNPLRGLGCCACLLPIGAGLLAVKQAVAKSAMPLSIGDGAILGVIAGAVAGLVNLIIGVPITYFINAATIEEQLAQLRQQMGIDLPFAGFALALVGGIIGIIIYTILSFIGGMIGIAVFEKRKDGAGMPPPPPPPGSYGGPTGTGYGDPTGGGYGGGSQPGGYGGGGAQGGGYGGAGGGAQGGGGWGGPGGSTGGGGSYGQGS